MIKYTKLKVWNDSTYKFKKKAKLGLEKNPSP